MESLSLLRLYFAATAMSRHTSWWRRFIPLNLGIHLLHRAKLQGIDQALLHRVIGGYIGTRELALVRNELIQSRLPLCLELIGKEEILQSFLQSNHKQLEGVRVVFLRGEEAHWGAERDRQTLEESLRINRATTPTSSEED